MKRETMLGPLVAVAVAVTASVGYWWLRSPESTRVKVGHAAPDLELPSIGTTLTTRLSSFRGRPVLLVMFLSNCRLCESQASPLERLHRELVRKGLVVVGVSADTDEEALRGFVRRHEITFLVLRDPGGAALLRNYGSYKLPEAYLIDASGKVQAVYLGSVDWRGPEVKERIESLLPPPRSAQGAR